MRAVTFDPATDRFSVRELPRPEPASGELLVRVAACGLNPADAKIVRWKGLVPAMTADWTPGLDVAGVVEAVGEGVVGWKAGDRVLYHGDMLKPHGGFAEFAVQAAATVLPMPKGVSDAEAAATPCAGWTAWRALHDKLRIGTGDTLLVLGAAGGVGGFALQLARQAGVTVVIGTSSAKNHAHLRALGATHAIDYATEDVVARVNEITRGAGVTRVLDCVGPDEDVIGAQCLGFEGEMCTLVSVARPEAYEEAFMRGLSFHQLSLGAGHRNGAAARERLMAAGRAFSALVEAGAVCVPVSGVIPLEEVPAALEEIRARRTVGKVVMACLR